VYPDIATPAGQVSLAQEREFLRAIQRQLGKITIVETDKSKPAKVDGFMITPGNVVAGVFETKCRDLSRDTLKRQYKNQWLITYEKICDGATVARLLQVAFYGFLYLVPDGVGLAIRLTDTDGNFVQPIRLAYTPTQRTCNGGSILRTNAYVDMRAAVAFPVRRVNGAALPARPSAYMVG